MSVTRQVHTVIHFDIAPFGVTKGCNVYPSHPALSFLAFTNSSSLSTVMTLTCFSPWCRDSMTSTLPSNLAYGTPQVGQLLNILFDDAFVAAHKQEDGSVQVPEPELFEQIKAGHAAGILRTRQEPVRIFSYYRSDLLHADAIRWE